VSPSTHWNISIFQYLLLFQHSGTVCGYGGGRGAFSVFVGAKEKTGEKPECLTEMEFWDLNLTKDLRVFCSMLFTVPSTGGLYRKPLPPGLKNPYKKNLRNNKTRVYSRIAFCRTEKQG
jgi:hypothetical protein